MENIINKRKEVLKYLPSERWLPMREWPQRGAGRRLSPCWPYLPPQNIGFSQYRWLGQTERRAGENSRISSAGLADFIHRGGLTRVYNTEIFTASYRQAFQRLQNPIRTAGNPYLAEVKNLAATIWFWVVNPVSPPLITY